ncbi:hypothetical protein BDV12DRAFT_199045 [Aspergillus spectabilis]
MSIERIANLSETTKTVAIPTSPGRSPPTSTFRKAVSKAGFIVVAFAAPFQGASGGAPRFVENPESRVSHFYYMITPIYGCTASKKKKSVVLRGISHYMLYDKPEAVKPALNEILPFLKQHLREAA